MPLYLMLHPAWLYLAHFFDHHCFFNRIVPSAISRYVENSFKISDEMSDKVFVIPPNRVRYLSEISENNRLYDKWVNYQKEIAQKLYALQKSISIISSSSKNVITQLKKEYETYSN